MLFVGSFRDNEAGEHVTVFDNMLSQLKIPTSKIRLDGLIEDDVNSMISNALGILPRLSKPLARQVYRKTNGNPYFVQEFLRSLVDLEKVQFSLRDRRWIWDDTEVSKENITENVLHLLSIKINGLCQGVQTALKVASCFGSRVDKVIVQQLSESGQYTNLLSDLKIDTKECCTGWNHSQYANLVSDVERAVECGFMDTDGIHYYFVHDKVREASYNMINGCKDRFHFELGMSMLHCGATKDNREVLLQQINHGVPSMVICTSHKNIISELNYEASCEMTSCANFTSALKHIKAAASLLPDDRWTIEYAASLKYLMQMARAALACGDIDAAQRSLNEIINNGKNLDDKLDAFFLIAAIPSRESLDTCIHVLRYVDMPGLIF
jgi:predicted ATPase